MTNLSNLPMWRKLPTTQQEQTMAGRKPSNNLDTALREANSSEDKLGKLDVTMRQLCCMMDFLDNVEDYVARHGNVPVRRLHQFVDKRAPFFVDVALLAASLGTSPAELVALAVMRAENRKPAN